MNRYRPMREGGFWGLPRSGPILSRFSEWLRQQNFRQGLGFCHFRPGKIQSNRRHFKNQARLAMVCLCFWFVSCSGTNLSIGSREDKALHRAFLLGPPQHALLARTRASMGTPLSNPTSPGSLMGVGVCALRTTLTSQRKRTCGG